MAREVNHRKVAIIGTGFVGSATAFALMQAGLFSEMVLIDADKEKEVRRGQLRERLKELKVFCDTSDISKDELMEELDRLYRK